MKFFAIFSGIFLLLLTGCEEKTAAVCKESEKIEIPATLRCPRCFKQSPAETVQRVNQQMSLCPACKKVSPAMKFYPRKRK
ncbi:MAG: hypothetical protein IJY46_10795 [Lentisphaeria bacterium]|nr:hypothetical protein [Lentisphaeria bacterium]